VSTGVAGSERPAPRRKAKNLRIGRKPDDLKFLAAAANGHGKPTNPSEAKLTNLGPEDQAAGVTAHT
jgi:hypothetical protein